MKKILLVSSIYFALSFFLGTGVKATELIFEFDNPSFGGNPFMGRHLLDSAKLQNKHEEKKKPRQRKNEIERFEDRLQRQILNRLARRIIETAFGEDDSLTPGTHVIGDNTIEVTDDGSVITIVITNNDTGNSTMVEVPYF